MADVDSLAHLPHSRSSDARALGTSANIAAQLASRDGGAHPFRGYFDEIDYAAGVLTIPGWMCALDCCLDEFRVQLNGETRSAMIPLERWEVGRDLPFEGARMSGFRFEIECVDPLTGGWLEIDVIGLLKGRVISKLRTLYRLDYRDSWPEPPGNLMIRTTASDYAPFHWTIGLQTFSEYYRTIRRYANVDAAKRLLDWGCGCGRLTRFFLKHVPHLDVHGCDIDEDQIAWCAANLPTGSFAVVPASPPTAYDDEMFDLVVSWSVLTHLDRDVQHKWLAEMRRILAPGGLLLASVSGESLVRFFPAAARLEMLRDGISDSTCDPTLDGIAPAGYYRATLQSRDYTCREFSRYFTIVDYIRQGATSSQDLVVMRKP